MKNRFRILLSGILLAIFILSFLPPDAHAGSYDLYGVAVDENTEYIDLRRVPIHDEGEALIRTLPFLKSARYLDLDNCGLSQERILEIRDMFPNLKVIWRVNFSGMYYVRTNVKTILASYVGDGGLTDDTSCIPLTYCTDVVNLDLGHNNHMKTLDFVKYMPNLEVLIVAKDDIRDISALANCKKLRYLELYMNEEINDISALSGLRNLRDLEIGRLPKLTDLSPIYDLELDRLWIGKTTPIPPEQVEEYARRHPNCVINLEDDQIDSSWRYMQLNAPYALNVYWPQYAEIREIFGYSGSESSWSTAANDPYFYMAPGAIKPVYDSAENTGLTDLSGAEDPVRPAASANPEAAGRPADSNGLTDLTALTDLSRTGDVSSGNDPVQVPEEVGTRINVSGITSADIPSLLEQMAACPDLKTVDLGSDKTTSLTWAEIRKLQQAAPGVIFHYDFTLYDKSFSLTDTIMDLNHITINDQGELVREVIACMPSLQTLDMDFCNVDDEHMAAIRDDFPNIKVIWRVWFGGAYSVRTDVEKILASSPGVAGELKVYNTKSLRYCTDVKYLDVGHNEGLRDISYVAYMPKLEVAILAMLNVEDISPLANCTELEFLEIQTNQIKDLSPLKNLTKLHHLNICYNFDLTDISPLYGMTELERLWIGAFMHIPEEQIAEMQRRAPQCVINTNATDPHYDWRYGHERYDLLVQQFGYDKGAYSYSWLDPLYPPHN